jgi:hypothetical protein
MARIEQRIKKAQISELFPDSYLKSIPFPIRTENHINALQISVDIHSMN